MKDRSERRIDRTIDFALGVAVLAITMSAGFMGYGLAKMEAMEAKVEHLEGTMDLVEVRYANQTAFLKAHGIEVPE